MQQAWEGCAETASGVAPAFVFMFILCFCPLVPTVPSEWHPSTNRGSSRCFVSKHCSEKLLFDLKSVHIITRNSNITGVNESKE